MLDREFALKQVDAAYQARVDGNIDALADYFADGADFRIAGDEASLQGVPLHAGDTKKTLKDLMERFHFSDLKRVSTIVEGNKMAVQWELSIGVTGKVPVHTYLMDLIELDDHGKICSFLQFADTALVRRFME